jgi:hypothetical protein
MTIAQRLVFVFEWKGAVHSNRRGCQLTQPLEGKMVVYGQTMTCLSLSNSWVTHSIPLFTLNSPSLRIYVPSRSEWAVHPTSFTHSTQHSPSWEADRFTASQEIPHTLWEPEGSLPHSQVPATSNLDQLNPAHTSTPHFLKIHRNIILQSMPGSPQWSLFLRCPHQHPVYTSPLPQTRYTSYVPPQQLPN